MKRIVTLASGRGSNFRAVTAGLKDKRITGGKLVGLIVDRSNTGAEEFAQDIGIPAVVLDYKSFANRAQFDARLLETVDSFEPDLILALGFMRIINAEMVEKYYGKIINIHPALLPSFPGMNAQKQTFDYGVKIAGVTVHFMDQGVDTGPIILQSAVAVPEGAALEELSALLLKEEHKAIVRAVHLFCSDALRIEGRKVVINPTN